MKYDAIILGTGQAGLPLAYALAGRDSTVAIVEKGDIGGTSGSLRQKRRALGCVDDRRARESRCDRGSEK